MDVKIDFQLNRQFSVVERIIFRLVLNGFNAAWELGNALPVFSDTVIANGIKNLVNRQLLTADIEKGTLSISESIVAIIQQCHDSRFTITFPKELEDEIKKNGLPIIGGREKNVIVIKEAILRELLPGVSQKTYIDSLDFIMLEAKGGGENG